MGINKKRIIMIGIAILIIFVIIFLIYFYFGRYQVPDTMPEGSLKDDVRIYYGGDFDESKQPEEHYDSSDSLP